MRTDANERVEPERSNGIAPVFCGAGPQRVEFDDIRAIDVFAVPQVASAEVSHATTAC